MKNMKAFIRMMVIAFSGKDMTPAFLSKESKTPVATVRELIDFALKKNFLVQDIKDHKVVFNITKEGEDFAGYLKGYKEIFSED